MPNYVFDYSQYKIKVNKKRNFPTFLILVIFLFLFSFAFILKKNEKYLTFYVVEVESFASYKDAINLASELQELGAGGFINHSSFYSVYASIYESEGEANSVAKNLSSNYANSKTLKLKIKNLSKNKQLSNLVKTVNQTISTLTKLSLSFDKKETTFNEIKLKVHTLHDNLCEEIENLNITQDYPIQSLNNMKTSLELIKDSNEQSFSKDIKFHNLNILMNYSSFASLF